MKKKNVKFRGSKTHGYGSKKKHRGAGSKGGRGYAGSKKHKWIWIIKNEPDHFSKKVLKPKNKKKIINIRDIENIDSETIDLKKLGYNKLLGTGKIGRKNIIIDSTSKIAKQKIEKNNGKIIT